MTNKQVKLLASVILFSSPNLLAFLLGGICLFNISYLED